jgi:membrane protein implicated in regulation of membrane protease activity
MSKKSLIIIIRLAQIGCWISIVFLIFFMLMAFASGHKVPSLTYIQAAITTVFFIACIMSLQYLSVRIRARK